MKQVLVIGYGVSGRSAAEFLQAQGVRLCIIDNYAEAAPVCIDAFDEVVISPGIALSHPLVTAAMVAKIPIIGEVELALRHATQRCLGITGTNGKTTVTELVTHALRHVGKKAHAVGNVGVGIASWLLTAEPDAIIVAELSSFQLETMHARTLDAAVLLNITPDHLDRYADLRAYAVAKCRIQRCVKATGRCIVSDDVMREWPDLLDPGALSFGRENEEAAWALCQDDMSRDAFAEALSTFERPAHRRQWVREIDGVVFINDSKATNIDAVVYCLRTCAKPIWLIAGGVHKGASYLPWKEVFANKVRGIFTLGEAASLIEEELGRDFPMLRVCSMEEAVQRAFCAAKKGEIVLLSPGCSSYDMFENYEHRGEEFQKAVHSLVARGTP